MNIEEAVGMRLMSVHVTYMGRILFITRPSNP